MTSQQAGEILRDKGFAVQVFNEVVVVSLSTRNVSKMEIEFALNFDQSVGIVRSGAGVAISTKVQ